MNRRIFVLTIALLALAGSLGWLLRQRWLEARAHEREVLNQAARSRPLPPPLAVPAVTPASPAAYLDVAQKTLFSSDRNPNVLVDPPKPPPPPPPMPALPLYYGQMNFATPVVVLSVGKSDQKSYAVGDKVGDFVIEDFDHDSITFDWDGKTVQRKLAELVPKEAAQAKPAQQAVPAAVAPAPVALVAPPPPEPPPPSDKPTQVGNSVGGGHYACVAGDTSPNGAVIGGFKKLLLPGPMGSTCFWEQMQ